MVTGLVKKIFILCNNSMGHIGSIYFQMYYMEKTIVELEFK